MTESENGENLLNLLNKKTWKDQVWCIICYLKVLKTVIK